MPWKLLLPLSDLEVSSQQKEDSGEHLSHVDMETAEALELTEGTFVALLIKQGGSPVKDSALHTQYIHSYPECCFSTEL